jgi:LuxR family maltose regulon positive regulatory protein
MAQKYPLVQTKLYRPPIREDIVPRPHLLKRLDLRRQRPLTLISAPAGYGKTTLVSSWLDTLDAPSAWVSLDEQYDDLMLFLAYFLTAIHSMFPDAAEDTLALANGPEQPPIQLLTNSLINDLNQITVDLVLVLDDYHSIQDVDIHELISGLLRYPPPTMQIVLTTRSDPPLDLVNMRAKSTITEIRALDLRFNQAEASEYLRLLLRRPVDEETVVFLSKKSEGWVTGIRLLALSLNGIDTADLTQIERLENNHLVKDYLMSIIISLQEPAYQERLLHIAILDRFCAPLCTAIWESDGESGNNVNADVFVRKLVADNLFVTPLDTQQHWLRYHHLFQELLIRQLEKREPEEFIASLHRKAGVCFAK